MSDIIKKQAFNNAPKMQSVKIIFKNKQGDIIGEENNEYNNNQAR